MWRRAAGYLRRIIDAYNVHQCTLMASACAYCALLSLVPLLIVGISALGYFMGGSEAALNHVIGAIRGYLPVQTTALRPVLTRILMDRNLIGIFGLVGLTFAAHQLFMAMEPAMNMIWAVPETRHWVRQRSMAVVATFTTLCMLALDLAASALIAYLEAANMHLVPGRVETGIARAGLALIPVCVTTRLFMVLYQILPSREVPWRAALVGAVVGAVLWELTKVGFGIFLLHVHSYDRLYGSLSGLVILVVWVYYSMAILLLGAEIAADYEAARRGPSAVQARTHSGADLAVANGTVARAAEVSAPADVEA
jgi:membrane protein